MNEKNDLYIELARKGVPVSMNIKMPSQMSFELACLIVNLLRLGTPSIIICNLISPDDYLPGMDNIRSSIGRFAAEDENFDVNGVGDKYSHVITISMKKNPEA